MTPPKKGFKTTDEYIASFPQNVQIALQQTRQAIKDAAPKAQEVISYSMPAFKQNGILVWFAAFKNHIGFSRKCQLWKPSKKNYPVIKRARAPLGFLWMSQFQLNWSMQL